eukprot:scaffold68680_cov33-Tisochrysis_lutea.AAC.1
MSMATMSAAMNAQGAGRVDLHTHQIKGLFGYWREAIQNVRGYQSKSIGVTFCSLKLSVKEQNASGGIEQA